MKGKVIVLVVTPPFCYVEVFGISQPFSPFLAGAEIRVRTASPPADDPSYASSPHEQIDFSGDSADKVFNEDSEAELEVDRSIPKSEKPPCDTGIGQFVASSGKKTVFIMSISNLPPWRF